MRWILTGLSGLATYVFGFVLDPMQFPSEHWIVFAFVVVGVTMAAAHIGPLRIVKWLWSTMTTNSRPTRLAPQQNYQAQAMPAPKPAAQAMPAPKPANGVGDFVKLQLADAKRKLIEVQTEEARKTAEAKRQAMTEAEHRRAADHAARLAMRAQRAPAVVADAPAIVLPRMTLRQAIEQSTDRAWIVGQESALQADKNHKQTGQVLTFDYQVNHVAIIGATGGGKTESTAELFVYYARRFGLHVIVLDGKRGIDWQRFDGVVEWHNMTVETIEYQIDRLTALFNARLAELKNVGVGKIYDLPGKRRRPLFVILEEFGYVWSIVQQNKPLFAKLNGQIDDLFRLGRAAGIVMCLIDQAPETWSKQMRANAKFVVCYRLNGNTANVFNEYFAGKLPDKGTFTQGNVFYDAWWFADQMDLKRHCPRQDKRYISEQPVHVPVNGPVREPVRIHVAESVLHEMNSEQPVHEQAGGWQNGPNSAQNSVDPTAVEVFMNTGSWDAVAASFKQLYPQGGISDLARIMADIASDGRGYKNFKSTAAKYFGGAS